MWKLFALFCFVTTLLSIPIDIALAGGKKSDAFKITTKRDTDKVEVQSAQENAVFSIQSPTGISQATIERTTAKWPTNIVVRLHLKGLESLRVEAGNIRIDAAVSSRPDGLRIRQWKDGSEDAPLDSKSPYWMEIRIVSNDGKPAKVIPRNNGYFEVPLPIALFANNPKSIRLNWIDFYRN